MDQIIRNSWFLIFAVMCVTSCATYDVKLSEKDLNWKDEVLPANENIYHSIYLIGDVGGAKENESTIPLIELEKQLATDKRRDESTDVVFLGDNIYPVGMPPIGHQDRPLAEHKLNVQLESVRDFDGMVTFIPGNHDWYEYGREGLKRQEKYIEDYLSQYGEGFTDYFRPSDGCGNIEVMEISNDISLVTIDSHWFLTDKEEEYDFSDCDIKSRVEFVTAFADTMQALEDRKVMLTMHHPLYTVGEHSGKYPKKSIWMPLTEINPKLKIPQPILGGVSALMRSRITPQDVNSSAYASYRRYMIPPIEKHGNTIVAAGHEHTLQYHQINNINYIVSGSGSKSGATATTDYNRFASSDYGYALVDYYDSGSIWLSFYAQGDKTKFEIVYRAKLR